LELGLKLAASGALSASIDSSDGLAWSLHELAKMSKVGIQVQHVPISQAAKQFAFNCGYNATDLALHGGEEYNLIVTIRPNQLRLAQRAARGRLKPIGVVTPRARGVRLLKNEHEVKIAMKGWEHFRRQK
jgi:thiamine-monophosphate kinase